MEVMEFVQWLVDHAHTDVTIVNATTVRSTLHGKARVYERVDAVVSPQDGVSLFGDIERTAYWKRVAP